MPLCHEHRCLARDKKLTTTFTGSKASRVVCPGRIGRWYFVTMTLAKRLRRRGLSLRKPSTKSSGKNESAPEGAGLVHWLTSQKTVFALPLASPSLASWSHRYTLYFAPHLR